MPERMESNRAGTWILVCCPYGCQGSEAVEAYQDDELRGVLWCPNCKRTIATVQPLEVYEKALREIADTPMYDQDGFIRIAREALEKASRTATEGTDNA